MKEGAGEGGVWVAEVVKYVGEMAVVGLVRHNNHAILQHATAGLYEVVSRAVSKWEMTYVLEPPPPVVYRLAWDTTALGLSRLCALLVAYKTEWEGRRKLASKIRTLPEQKAHQTN